MKRKIQTCFRLSAQEQAELHYAALREEMYAEQPAPPPELHMNFGGQTAAPQETAPASGSALRFSGTANTPAKKTEQLVIHTAPKAAPVQTAPAPPAVPLKAEEPAVTPAAAPVIQKLAAESAPAPQKPKSDDLKAAIAKRSTEQPQKKPFPLGAAVGLGIAAIIVLYLADVVNEHNAGLMVFGIINFGVLISWFKKTPAKILSGAAYVIFLFMYCYTMKETGYQKLEPPFELLYMAITLFPMMASLFGVFFDDEDHKKTVRGVYSVLLIGSAALTGFQAGMVVFAVICVAGVLGLIRALIKH